jgi:succinate dehydrogenase / fumarate reductase cytochrome b subunit
MAVMTVTRTTIGKKVLMAVTGLIWIGFLFFHMFGNTKAFFGAEYFNHYAEALREFGAPVLAHGQFLFLFRIVTVTALAVHIWMAVSLTRRNLTSRGSRYAVHKKVHADAASLTMRYGGIAIALFLLFHLAQFTWGVEAVLPSYQEGMPYENMIAGFSSLPVTLLYLVALVFVGLHLYHGTWSMFQTLGLNNSRSTTGLHWFALALAVIIAGGFALVPLAVTFGYLS